MLRSFGYQDILMECDRPYCRVTFGPLPARGNLRQEAADYGWHVPPCECPWKDEKRFIAYRWQHSLDFCPDHWPLKPRPVETLPPL